MKRFFLICVCCVVVASYADETSRPPNILFIAIDDMNDWTGFLGGHPQVQTPNLDRLARRGVNFTNAHCSAPGCSPSRNALLYGVEPFHSGLYAFYDQDQFPEQVLDRYVSLPEFFKKNGYETFGSGKIHHRREPTPQEWTEFFTPPKTDPFRFDETDGYRQGKSGKMNFSPTLNPFEDHTDWQNATFGVDVLSRKHDKPFFLAVGIIKPHLPFICPKQFFDLYPAEVDPPRIKENDLNDVPKVGKAMAKIGDDRRFKKDEAWNKVRRAYLACISWADYNIGRLIDALEAGPYADSTVIVLWSDHGFALGEKNHFRKFALWEETTRTPFIILDLRDQPAPEGRTVSNAVSLINIYRTLADLAGLKAPETIAGTSLVPQLNNPDAPLVQPAVCTWGRGNYTVRDRDWRYTRYYDDGEELYDHRKDPDEWTNLAANPEYASVKERLARFLPEREAPLIEEGIETWSVPFSADRLLEQKK
ncbi:sulfatase [Tichowtungia aerotolerans]|uniref:Sulfatase-like hydrolase/transferase n=1 Tax=Tichowtungia aerotolerans TaxID=2697043 RepID=A0A6P1M6X0_9BACT|nr:sulfatase [Tichowtungia aerotolerans]QHI70330.1 sulfatase-like hydrolase/transferase [Tichowtungia aerotolerans]